MKRTNWILIYLIIVASASAQPGIVDSFRNKLNTSIADTNRVNLLVAWAESYNDDNSDSVVMLTQQGIDLARELHYARGEVRCLVAMGNGYYVLGNYIKAVQVWKQAMTLSDAI